VGDFSPLWFLFVKMTRIISVGLPRLHYQFYQKKNGQTSKIADDCFKDSKNLRFLMLKKTSKKTHIFFILLVKIKPYIWLLFEK
jgi:hypothetical protein